MTKIKLCGLKRKEDIITANVLMPDYIGFVFYPLSRRALNIDQAEELKALLDPDITAVGVFVDEEIGFIKELLDRRIIDAVQLHGNEDAEYIKRLRSMTDKCIIKALRIREVTNDHLYLADIADHILLDPGMGDGKTFDWDIIRKTEVDPAKLFLAGGLDPENVADAVRFARPYAVDVSSGIETDGVKDAKKMEQFVLAVKNADNQEVKDE